MRWWLLLALLGGVLLTQPAAASAAPQASAHLTIAHVNAASSAIGASPRRAITAHPVHPTLLESAQVGSVPPAWLGGTAAWPTPAFPAGRVLISAPTRGPPAGLAPAEPRAPPGTRRS